MLNPSEIKAYLLDELALERDRLLYGYQNNYEYLYRICNDLGIFDTFPPVVRAEAFHLIDVTGCIADM
ncbi:MAG: hypothetical protein J6K72_08315 [Clostridia bacterium]|nr:hypothetical protein [Clostridia bacterium]